MLPWLESTQYSAWMRSELWGWPLALTLHAFGTALVFGFMLIISLRLVGLFETIPYPMLRRLFSVVWVGVALQLLTGLALWVTKPTQYVADVAFMLKVALVLIGIVLTLASQAMVRREADAWQAAGVSSKGAKFIAATLLVWCGALVAGRLTAHLGSFYIG
jgi:hypothetical protein